MLPFIVVCELRKQGARAEIILYGKDGSCETACFCVFFAFFRNFVRQYFDLMTARPLWPYYRNGAKSDRQHWKNNKFLSAFFGPERDKIVVFMWRTDKGIEKPRFLQFFGNRNFNAFFDQFPEGGQFFPISIMSTIFTNQTPWITLADAVGVFSKKSRLFLQKMSINCWV